MPRFAYEAMTHNGDIQSGVLEAASKSELISKLQNMGYFPTSISEADKSKGRSLETPKFFIFKRVKASDLEFFSFQLATLITAGVPLVKALEVCMNQISNEHFKIVVSKIKADVEEGTSFHEALRAHPNAFSDLYVNMVSAGEAGGVLGIVLSRLAEFSERERRLKTAVSSALFYPAILIIMSSIALLILTLFVIPKFTVMFAEMEVPLPWPTRILIAFTNFIKARWWAIFGTLLATAMAFRSYAKSEKGKKALDHLKIQLPLLGGMFRAFALARFSRTLGTLLENGVVMLTALKIVKETIGNLVYKDTIATCAQELEHGSTLALPMERSGVFPALVTHMIAIGEESGSPEGMLNKLAEYYDTEVKKYLDRITGILGPIVILIMGLIIGSMAVSIILPILEASTMLG